MEKCKSASRYKGIHPPKCNGGDPCEYCKALYEARHAGKVKTVLEFEGERLELTN